MQFVVCSAETGERLGLVQLIRMDHRGRTAHLSYFVADDVQGAGWTLEAVFLFVDYVFKTIDLRKIYIESLEYSVEEFRSAVGKYIEEEGTLRGHDFFDGEYLDLHIFAIYRDGWMKAKPLIQRMVPEA